MIESFGRIFESPRLGARGLGLRRPGPQVQQLKLSY